MNHQEMLYALNGGIIRMQEMLAPREASGEVAGYLSQCLNLIQTKRYRVAVVGEFNRGKSSLIDALLGMHILPVDIVPTTAVINRVVYGQTPGATVHYKSGETEAIALENLAAYVTQRQLEDVPPIREVIVRYPTVICQNNVELLDTPGLNDDDAMSRVTLSVLPEVDAVLVVISADSPLSDTEVNNICRLVASESIYDIVFALSFMDTVMEDYDEKGERDRRFDAFVRNRAAAIGPAVEKRLNETGAEPQVLEKARALFSPPRIYGISAKQMLTGLATNNRALIEESRFTVFSKELLTIVTAKQIEHTADAALLALREAVRTIRRAPRGRVTDSQAEAAVRALEEYAKTIRGVVHGRLAMGGGAVEKALAILPTLMNGIARLMLDGEGMLSASESEEIIGGQIMEPVRQALMQGLPEADSTIEQAWRYGLMTPMETLGLSAQSLSAPFPPPPDTLPAAALACLKAAVFSWALPGGQAPDATDHRALVQAIQQAVTRYGEALRAEIPRARTVWLRWADRQAQWVLDIVLPAATAARWKIAAQAAADLKAIGAAQDILIACEQAVSEYMGS